MYGKGQIEASGLFENEFKDCIYHCQNCYGKGYTESDKPTTEINLDYYEELERLARIGKATEKAFESGFSINQMHSVLSNVDYCMYDKESLLNWAESDGK